MYYRHNYRHIIDRRIDMEYNIHIELKGENIMGHDEMIAELAKSNRVLQTLNITSTYDNMIKLASVMESIDRVIGNLQEQPAADEPEEHNEKPPEQEE